MHVSYDNIDVVCIEPEYPKSVNALLIKEVTGKENPEGVGAVGLHNIWSLGRVGVTGLPLMETVITIGSQTKWANYIVKNGMWIGQLLDFSGIDLHAGDIVSAAAVRFAVNVWTGLTAQLPKEQRAYL